MKHLALCCLALAGCRWFVSGDAAEFSPVRSDSVHRVVTCAPSACTDSMDVIAMGVSGYLFMAWRDTMHLAMTPPAFTNPSVARVLLGDWFLGTTADTARMMRRLAAMPMVQSRLARVGPVLAGHGHYDHLMDLPPMMRRMPNARVYGSRTVVNLLAGDPALRGRTEQVDTLAAVDTTTPGRWVTTAPWRFKAIDWEHAHNFPGISYSPGEVKVPATGMPRTAAGWKRGRVFAYAIDLIAADSSTACRLFVHDAAASVPVVERASTVLRREAPARAIITVISAANYDRVSGYPDTLLRRLSPRHVVLGHWEEFFRSPEKSWRRVRGIDGNALRARVKAQVDSQWNALEPGAVLRVLC